MEKEVKLIFDEEQFENIGAPKCGSYELSSYLCYPDKIRFNKTYYVLRKGMLQAFRVLAIAFKRESSCGGTSWFRAHYLVQTPGEGPMWIENFLVESDVVFEHRDDFYAHIEGDVSVNIFHDYKFRDARTHLEGSRYYQDKKIFGLWYIVKGEPRFTDGRVKYFLICDDGIYINLERRRFDYTSREECLKSYLQDFEIDDFEEEKTENEETRISFDIKPNTQRVITIRVVED